MGGGERRPVVSGRRRPTNDDRMLKCRVGVYKKERRGEMFRVASLHLPSFSCRKERSIAGPCLGDSAGSKDTCRRRRNGANEKKVINCSDEATFLFFLLRFFTGD